MRSIQGGAARAGAIVALMVLLQFNPLVVDRVDPMFLGAPIAYWYLVLYAFASVAAVWLVTKLVWPRDEIQDRTAPSGHDPAHGRASR